VFVSRHLRSAVKLAPVRQYRLARQIGVCSSTLSGWLNGISEVQPDDPRVLKLAGLLNVPAVDAFSTEEP
jgi:transcriptional regulator with XRE-family HTH domain